jgi:hypothetical protein
MARLTASGHRRCLATKPIYRRIAPIAVTISAGAATIPMHAEPAAANRPAAPCDEDFEGITATTDEGTFLCECITVPNGATPDMFCDWIGYSRSDVNTRGNLRVPYNGALNVGGSSTIFGNIGETWSYTWSFIRNNWDDGVGQPPGELSTRTRLMKWDGQAWATCRDTGFVYNELAGTFGLGLRASWGDRPCGTAQYQNVTSSFAWEVGAWRGGTVNSGSFYWDPITPIAPEAPGASMSPQAVRPSPSGPPPLTPAEAGIADRPDEVDVTELAAPG